MPTRFSTIAVARNLAKWVQPKLVAEVEFRAWTTDRQLRHAAFKGLREDKAAEEGGCGRT
jgi:bifunctional non-homologous end joining protein LigD